MALHTCSRFIPNQSSKHHNYFYCIFCHLRLLFFFFQKLAYISSKPWKWVQNLSRLFIRDLSIIWLSQVKIWNGRVKFIKKQIDNLASQHYWKMHLLLVSSELCLPTLIPTAGRPTFFLISSYKKKKELIPFREEGKALCCFYHRCHAHQSLPVRSQETGYL